MLCKLSPLCLSANQVYEFLKLSSYPLIHVKYKLDNQWVLVIMLLLISVFLCVVHHSRRVIWLRKKNLWVAVLNLCRSDIKFYITLYHLAPSDSSEGKSSLQRRSKQQICPTFNILLNLGGLPDQCREDTGRQLLGSLFLLFTPWVLYHQGSRGGGTISHIFSVTTQSLPQSVQISRGVRILETLYCSYFSDDTTISLKMDKPPFPCKGYNFRSQ